MAQYYNCFPLPAFGFSLLASPSPLLASRFSLPAPHFSLLASRFLLASLLASRFSHASLLTSLRIELPQGTFLEEARNITISQSPASNVTPANASSFLSSGKQCTVPREKFAGIRFADIYSVPNMDSSKPMKITRFCRVVLHTDAIHRLC